MEFLKIEDWVFVAPNGDDLATWRTALARADATGEPRPVAADLVPATHRRRMSNLSKMAVQAALKLSGAGADLLVFGSRHGELVRTRKLLTAIADNEVLSPTAFSQSVHNTSAGLYSIIAGTHAPSSSLASGASTFASAWIEAEGFLAEYPAGKVLIVDCDDTLPVQYREFVTAAPCAYAVGLVLSVGPGVRLQFESSASAAATEWPIGPLFLEWWRTAASSFEVVAEGQQFKWERFVEP